MLKVIVCADVDHDVLGYGVPGTRFNIYKERLGWKSVKNIRKVKEICNSIEDNKSNSAKSHGLSDLTSN